MVLLVQPLHFQITLIFFSSVDVKLHSGNERRHLLSGVSRSEENLGLFVGILAALLLLIVFAIHDGLNFVKQKFVILFYLDLEG